MIRNIFVLSWIVLLSIIFCSSLRGQENNATKPVNPLIGTTQTKTKALWGAEGGTYPGAVAPFGYMQLTPETKASEPYGYDFRDSTICFFSCTGHRSGYPNGSAGKIRVMPVDPVTGSPSGNYSRTFSHSDEISTPGYYSVLFRDNGTRVESTASVHAGIFRFTFPPQTTPMIFLGDMGTISFLSGKKLEGSKLNTVVLLNREYIAKKELKDGILLTFPAAGSGENILLLKIGASELNRESTARNLDQEIPSWDFDSFCASNRESWQKKLSMIEVEDTSTVNKTIFYTALYHSFLLPWIVSDADGFYRGSDGLVHQAKGLNQYSGFSVWDTFRTLHPLLSLLLPDTQGDIIRSMLDQYSQAGQLPIGPMTGHHVIPVIVDSYLKGICNFDSLLAWEAMTNCLSQHRDEDFSAYLNLGYVPSSFSESVTKTLEYSYDDWALSRFAGSVMKDTRAADSLLKRSRGYRNLLFPESLFFVPGNGSDFISEPGNSGYKEGDKWSYSFFVPQDPIDLINLMGGKEAFVSRLDSALTRQDIFFDNEPVFHIHYLFNYAGRPDKTQEWVRKILSYGFKNTADGLPGNDDLGSMSSWYVFNALGFYPLCPGRPGYDTGTPIFKKVTIHLPGKKEFILRTTGNPNQKLYVKDLFFNGLPIKNNWISHKDITAGGMLDFVMDHKPAIPPVKDQVSTGPSETKHSSSFKISGFHLSKEKVRSDEVFHARFAVNNSGPRGTIIVKLHLDGREYLQKNVVVDENDTVHDSIACRLYGTGMKILMLGNQSVQTEVVTSSSGKKTPLEVTALRAAPACRINSRTGFEFTIMNKGGLPVTDTLSVKLDGRTIQQEIVTLDPGKIRKISSGVTINNAGIHTISVGSVSERIKIYEDNRDSKIADIPVAPDLTGDSIPDRSGLLNFGLVRKISSTESQSGQVGRDTLKYIEFAHSRSLDELKDQITIMAWVYPRKQNQLSDIISKGDNIVLQATGTKKLTFFAGGWGRGVCETDLPANWAGDWHHIAGVYNGNTLELYIDGILSACEKKILPGNLISHAKWMIGRNEEFPDQRFFNGWIDQVKIFAEPLSHPEIKSEMQAGHPRELK